MFTLCKEKLDLGCGNENFFFSITSIIQILDILKRNKDNKYEGMPILFHTDVSPLILFRDIEITTKLIGQPLKKNKKKNSINLQYDVIANYAAFIVVVSVKDNSQQ